MRPWNVCVLLAFLFLPTVAAAPVNSFLPVKLRGQPTFEPGKTAGYFIWTDKEGLHVRWSINGKPLLFSGKFEFDRPFEKQTRVFEEGGGWVRNHGGRIVMFSSTLRETQDGFDIAFAGSRKVKVELKIDQNDPAMEQIHLGQSSVHPKGLPLVLFVP